MPKRKTFKAKSKKKPARRSAAPAIRKPGARRAASAKRKPVARRAALPKRKPAPRAAAPKSAALAAPVAIERYTEEYREYLTRYALMGRGRPRLDPGDFEKFDNELIDLLTIQGEIGALSDEQVVRLQELEFLLLDTDQ